ncbi:hypothetical protein ABBQ38_001881 [Trebouxia sp. C0009 RCD-2024]
MPTRDACTAGVYSYTYSRQQRCSRIPQAASLHRDKLYARRLPDKPPALIKKGYLHSQMTADKPGKSDASPPMPPDISMLSPELQHQWHVDSNRHLGAVKVKPQSAIKAVWQCKECPAGSCMSGQHLCTEEPTAPSVLIVQTSGSACITHLQP